MRYVNLHFTLLYLLIDVCYKKATGIIKPVDVY